jgi:hypothetical protein
MQVTHRIHHQDVHVARKVKHVLRERSNHVPWFEMNDGTDPIESVSCDKRDSDFPKSCIRLNQMDNIFPTALGVRNGEVDSKAGTPESDDLTDTEKENAQRVRPFGTLRAITQRADKDNKDEGDVELVNRKQSTKKKLSSRR